MAKWFAGSRSWFLRKLATTGGTGGVHLPYFGATPVNPYQDVATPRLTIKMAHSPSFPVNWHT